MNSRTRPAFSMIEIMVALAIVSFALVAVLGLFAAGIGLNRSSNEDTLVAAMANRVASEQRASASLGWGGIAATNYWFDAAGFPVAGRGGAVYGCAVTVTTNALALADVSTNLVQLQLAFSWPVQAPAAARRTRNFHIASSRARPD